MSVTLLDIRTRVLEPIDAIEAISNNDDAMYSVAEVNRYINEGIKKAEAMIHNIYEDYFLSYAFFNIVSGTSEYQLPSDIYANKIRTILFDNGSDKYVVRKHKHLEKLLDVEIGDHYKYLLLNKAGVGTKFKFTPTPNFSSNSTIAIYYIREAAKLETDGDELDIPEFADFVVLYARKECLKKQIGNPMLLDCKAELKEEGQAMVDTLSTMIPDQDYTLEVDTSFYEDFYNTELL